MEMFNFKKLNKIEGKGQHYVEILNRFTSWENLDANLDVNRD
jgi:hypothetical protein